MNIPIMKENQLSIVGKGLVIICVVVFAAAAFVNVLQGEATHPGLLVIAIAGLVLFLAAKVSVIGRRHWISFGTKFMSPAMANAYRAGYWLMFVGALATFL